MKCRICDNHLDNKEYMVREMMFGTKEEFLYFECAHCGCLQIADRPSNMERYYPSGYVSFAESESSSAIRWFFEKKRNEYVLFGRGLLGRIVHSLHNVRLSVDIIKNTGVERCSRILDVGCGNGRSLLCPLRKMGFNNLFGVDPYIATDIVTDRLRIFKKNIDELPDTYQFDLIVLSHSLEHIWDHNGTLVKARSLLSEKGVCLVRIPLKTDYIWHRYGVNWVQLDAPRHFFLHTQKSFKLLANEAGLAIRNIVFDSTDVQFWGSEQYMANIPYRAENSHFVNPERSIFSSMQIKQYKKMAEQLNVSGQGDQAAFYLVKA